MHGGLAFPALSHRQTRSTSGQLNQRRSISLWSDGNSPAPIIGSDGKLQTAASSTGATASTTPSTSASQAVTPTAASEELGIDFQSASSTAPISSTTPPHTFSLETIPTELSESINETRRTLQEYGLGGSTPSGWVQSLLEWVHLTTGLPWYATIGLTVITVRMMLLPIMVGGISNNARLARIQPQLMANIASIKKAQQDGNTLQVHKLQLATRQLFEDNKCGPLRGLMLPLIQMPLFISFFFALRGMAAAGLPDFTTGGVAWFTNLSIPDPYYVLPVVSAAATLAVLQVSRTFERACVSIFRVLKLCIVIAGRRIWCPSQTGCYERCDGSIQARNTSYRLCSFRVPLSRPSVLGNAQLLFRPTSTPSQNSRFQTMGGYP